MLISFITIPHPSRFTRRPRCDYFAAYEKIVYLCTCKLSTAMSTDRSCPPPEPVTSRAAANGVVMSGCILFLVLACGFAMSSPLAVIALWAGSLAMPVVIYKMLRRSARRACRPLGFAELWAEGIATFFLGSLIPAVVAYFLIKYVCPDFVSMQLAAATASLEQIGTPEAQMWIDTLDRLLSQGAIPGAADIAANLISFNIVAGTVLSLIVAVPVSIAAARKPNDCNKCQ